MQARTLYDKLWDSHVVRTEADGTALLYIDRHLVHEVTSPQAFEGLKLAGRKPWRVESIVATADHNTPTQHWDRGHRRPDLARRRSRRSTPTSARHGAKAYFPFRDRRQGIVHVIGPEQGATLPGMTVVCGDSHTSTHGAFGCARVRHRHVRGRARARDAVPADARRRRRCWSRRRHACRAACTAKDIALAVIGRIGTAGGTRLRDRVRRRGDPRAVDGRPHDGVQHGDRGGRARRHDRASTTRRSPISRAARSRRTGEMWDRAVAHWRTLKSRCGREVRPRRRRSTRRAIAPQVTWGTSPEMVTSIEGRVPDPDTRKRPDAARRHRARARVHGARARTRAMTDIRDRQGVHRLVHQLAHRGPARRGGRRARPPRRATASSSRWSCPAPGS